MLILLLVEELQSLVCYSHDAFLVHIATRTSIERKERMKKFR